MKQITRKLREPYLQLCKWIEEKTIDNTNIWLFLHTGEFSTLKCGSIRFSQCSVLSLGESLDEIGSIKAVQTMHTQLFLLLFSFSLLMGQKSIELNNHLNHLIDYVRNHRESQMPDLMLGIYLCEGNEWNKSTSLWCP